jgi:hypothetical protein
MTRVTFYFSPCLTSGYTQSILNDVIEGPSGREAISLQKVNSLLVLVNVKEKLKKVFCHVIEGSETRIFTYNATRTRV